MSRFITWAGIVLAALLILPTSVAWAGNSLVVAGTRVAVARSRLMVTPSTRWNRLGYRRVRSSETWTLDGEGLNDLTFYGGLPAGQTMFRDISRRTAPLPRFASNMLLTDIPVFFESSYRIARQTALITIGTMAPTNFLGVGGVSFTYRFTPPDGVRRNGEVRASIVDGKLYMVSFEAPAIYFFDRDVEKYRLLLETVRIGS